MGEVSTQYLTVIEDLYTGVDAGATKIDVADTRHSRVQRRLTDDYDSMDHFLDSYILEIGAVPKKTVVGMPGARDDETGVITPTNNEEIQWPAFDPRVASTRYGAEVITKNDMEVAAAGVLEETESDWHQIKPGVPTETGTKLIGTHSSGIGSSATIWDSRSKRFVIMASEGGHIGWQPKDDWETGYLNYLNLVYPHVSAEFALSGLHGINHLIEYSLVKPDGTTRPSTFRDAINEARLEDRPVGAVLIELATAEEDGAGQELARTTLKAMGAMTGSVLRDLTVATKATGGVYMTGSVALSMYEYLAKNTEFNNRFVREGAKHADWLEAVPINLVVDPHVAAIGALSLAKDRCSSTALLSS